jgi:hypothetical protein
MAAYPTTVNQITVRQVPEQNIWYRYIAPLKAGGPYAAMAQAQSVAAATGVMGR